MDDSYSGDAYEVRSDDGRCLGVVHQVAPDRWVGHYSKADREREITSPTAVGAANRIIADVDLCN